MRAKVLFVALVLAVSCAHDQRPAAASGEIIEAFYPEGPLWQGERLYFAEMGADRVSVFEDGQRRDFFVQPGCGPTALAPYGEGFLVLCHIGARVVAVDAQGHALRTWERDDARHMLRDPNDATADGAGGVYFSDPGQFARTTRPHGYVMHLTADGALTRVAGPLWYPNGVFFDAAEHALYVTEHMSGRILRYPIEANGALGEPLLFVDVDDLNLPSRYDAGYPETGPDGLERGPGGDLFVAIYGEGRILRLSRAGVLVDVIELPTRYLTNIAFSAAGAAATTGTFENLDPPYPGQVLLHPAAGFRSSD